MFWCLGVVTGVVVVMWHWDLVAVAVWRMQVSVDVVGGVWVEVRELSAELFRVVGRTVVVVVVVVVLVVDVAVVVVV